MDTVLDRLSFWHQCEYETREPGSAADYTGPLLICYHHLIAERYRGAMTLADEATSFTPLQSTGRNPPMHTMLSASGGGAGGASKPERFEMDRLAGLAQGRV